MRGYLFVGFVIIWMLSSCSLKPRTTPYLPLVKKAIKRASPVGKRILTQAHSMGYQRPKVIRGSCWDYIHAIYTRAGYGVRKKIVFKGSKKGPFAPIYKIESGDWLYHINHEYHGIQHSGIFVDWVDVERRKALMLSYQGGNASKPARYKIYTLSSVYRITRGR